MADVSFAPPSEPVVVRSFSEGGQKQRLRSFNENGELNGDRVSSTSTPITPASHLETTNDEGATAITTTMEITTSTTEKTTVPSREKEKLKFGKPASRESSGLSISTAWEGLKRMMGFEPECHNGGYKTLGSGCICPQFYEGKSCERIMCANNGTRVRVAAFGGEEVCKCANPDYISGKHCEVVQCQNGGRLLNDGTCHCVDGWYSGQFCQFYTSSWLIAVGVPLLAIAIIAFCCVLCRLDMCAMRRPSPPNTGRHRDRRVNGRRLGQNGGSPSERRGRNGAGSGGGGGNRHRREQIQFRPMDHELGMAARHQQYIQQNLLNDRQHQYVLRLEQVPVYNPRLYLSADPTKPLEPPPSYEQAVLCSPPRENCPPLHPPIGVSGNGTAEDDREEGGGRTNAPSINLSPPERGREQRQTPD